MAKIIHSKVYFAHPMAYYNTDIERLMLEMIKMKFPYTELVNPSERVHADACKGKMQYFETLVASCPIIVACAYPDGLYGMGVYRELNIGFYNKARLFTFFPKLSLEQQDSGATAQVLAPLDGQGFRNIRPLSIQETHDRNAKIIQERTLDQWE